MASALRATGLLDDFWKVKLYRAAHEQLQILILMDRTLDAGKNHALQGSSSGMLRLKNVCNRSTMFQNLYCDILCKMGRLWHPRVVCMVEFPRISIT